MKDGQGQRSLTQLSIKISTFWICQKISIIPVFYQNQNIH